MRASILLKNYPCMGKAERVQNTLDAFIGILGSVEQDKERRAASLDRMFWEYNNLNINEFEDTETKFAKIVAEKRTYPPAFVASSLGFNKSTMQVKYNDVLMRFGLERRPVVASLRNALHYEKLKIMIIKYYECLRK